MSDLDPDNLTDLVTNLNFEATMKLESADLDVEVEFEEQKMKGSRKSTRVKRNIEDRDILTGTYESGNENIGVQFASA